jgi:hypothetical protein
MMRKNKILFLAFVMSILTLTASAQKKEFDWNPVMDAIIQVESKGNAKAHNPNGDCAGILQITPILVKECNQILQNKKSSKRYVYDKKGECRSSKWDDRYSVEKSKEMFIMLQEHFNPEHNIEKAIRCWNSGFYGNWRNRSGEYYRKVMKYYKGGK